MLHRPEAQMIRSTSTMGVSSIARFILFDCFISLISLISLNHIVSHIVLDLQAVKFKLPV